MTKLANWRLRIFHNLNTIPALWRRRLDIFIPDCENDFWTATTGLSRRAVEVIGCCKGVVACDIMNGCGIVS